MAQRNPLHPIPHPPKRPIIGNLLSLSGTEPVQDLVRLAGENGPIYWLDMMGKPIVVVSGADLVEELSDETRFDKSTRGKLRLLRPLAHGLFVSDTAEPNWSKAHNILLPTFAQRAMQGYHAAMLDVAQQLVLKWERLNPEDEVDVTEDMTRLTLDTIGLCGFNYRFNSFYRDGNHPFVDAMVRSLETIMSSRGLPLEELMNRRALRQLREDIGYMHELVERIIRERRAAGAIDAKDLLAYMLEGVDKKTGERLDDRQIRDETITFLIAGHETTSGLLSFATYALLNHPDVLAKAYAEVDRVLGTDPSVMPTYQQVNKLTYIGQILKETLRLWPTAPAYAVSPLTDTQIGGRYPLKKRSHVMVMAMALHRDKSVWGPDADRFDPENFSREREAARPVHAYKPFGNGQRACIGRQFALQEATLVMGMLLQRFELIDHTRYQLKIKESLTIKPEGFRIKVRPRLRRNEPAVSAPTGVTSGAHPGDGAQAAVTGAGRSLTLAYGTSLGTCRDIVDQMAARASDLGFVVKTASLDEFAGNVPEEGTLVVVTATYNGRAPDSATRMEHAIEQGRFATAKRPNLTYAVLGCGNSQWRTFQAFPKLIDETLRGTGATPLLTRGEADGNSDFDAAVEQWMVDFWKVLGAETATSAAAAPQFEITYAQARTTRASVLPEEAYPLRVLANEELVRDPTGLWDPALEAPRSSTRHMTIALPEGVAYRTGDHLAIYARNRPQVVDGIVGRLGLQADTVVTIKGHGGSFRHLPVDQPVTVGQLLRDFVELQDPASRRDVRVLAEHTRCPHTLAALARLIESDADAFAREVTEPRVSVYDLLTRYPAIELPLDALLRTTAAIRPRFYSISSSPLAQPHTASLTVGTVAAPAWSGAGFYQGVASSYLQAARPGDELLGFVRRPNPPFSPPEDPELPMILIGPGSGFAPFRGFLQERAAQRASGIETSTALVFYGCRHPDHDWFYREEMAQWERDGVAALHLAFSSLSSHPHRFVQDALWEARDVVWRTLEAGGMVFVCGDGRFMAPAVRDTLIRIHQDRSGTTMDESSDWLEGMIASGRYHQDVFGFK